MTPSEIYINDDNGNSVGASSGGIEGYNETNGHWSLGSYGWLVDPDGVSQGIITHPNTDGVIATQEWVDAQGFGAAEWGAITGTLSDQTDLQEALDARALNDIEGNIVVADAGQTVANGTYLRNDNAPVTGVTPVPGSRRWVKGVTRIVNTGSFWYINHESWGNLYVAPGDPSTDPGSLTWTSTNPSYDPSPTVSIIHNTIQGAFDEVRGRQPEVLFSQLGDVAGPYAVGNLYRVNASATGLDPVTPVEISGVLNPMVRLASWPLAGTPGWSTNSTTSVVVPSTSLQLTPGVWEFEVRVNYNYSNAGANLRLAVGGDVAHAEMVSTVSYEANQTNANDITTWVLDGGNNGTVTAGNRFCRIRGKVVVQGAGNVWLTARCANSGHTLSISDIPGWYLVRLTTNS